MFIPDKTFFQPSSQTLSKWLATRKGDIVVGRIPMPRYFSDVGNSKDQFWFIIAIIGELLGLGTALAGGMRSGGTFLIFAAISIIMFIFCDFFFAYKLHRNKENVCRLSSMQLLIDDNEAADLAKIRQQLNKGKFADFMYQAGIIIIALVKVVGIVLLGVFNELIVYVPFAIIYFIVAYIHIQHTGYYFAYRGVENAMDRDYNEFINGENKAQEIRERVSTTKPLVDLPIKHNPHQIAEDHELIEEEEKGSTYVIIAKGVLNDEDIVSLIAGQSDENKITLFKACRKLQLGNY